MRASSVFNATDVAADCANVDASDGLGAFAFGFGGQGWGVCAGGFDFDVGAAMASVAVCFFGGALDVWAAMDSVAVGLLRGIGPFGV